MRKQRKPHMIGIEEIIDFITKESSNLPPARIRMNAKQFYQFLFSFATQGRLHLYFVCTECTKKMGDCRCSGWYRGEKWFYHISPPAEVAWRWRLSRESVLELPSSQIAPHSIQTATRIRNFIKYLEQGTQ